MRTDLIVVGAGPAGLAAAAAAGRAGLAVTVVDERSAPGGRVAGPVGASAVDPESAWIVPPYGADEAARERVARLYEAASGATFLFDALVWGLFSGWTAAVTREGRTRRIDADQVVLATGRYVVRPPFPGHEEKSVFTPLGLYRALEGGEIAPDARIAVLGGGALADAIVADLRARGVEAIVRLADEADDGWRPGADVRLLAAPPRVRRRAGRLELGLSEGPGSEDTLVCDALIVAGPEIAASDLAQLAGCDHHFDGYERGFRPILGPDGASSVPGIFLAGSVAGALGDEAIERSGTIAGLAAAVRAERTPAGHLRTLLATDQAAAPPPTRIPRVYRDLEAASAATACRCIGTTCADVAAAIGDGARSLDDVKRRAKAGMGLCQGRECHRTVIRLLERVGDIDVSTLRPMRARPPIRPISAGAMFEGEPST